MLRNVLIAIYWIGLISCKYSLSGVSVPIGVITISIEQLSNNAPIVSPLFATRLSDGIRNIFQSQTNLTIVRSQGDFQLSGQITNYSIQPITIQGNEQAAQNRLSVTIEIEFQYTKKPELNWKQQFSAFDDFPAATPLPQVESRLQEIIIERLSQDVFNRTLANW
jgi:hypothetical protein